jgi:hypothetical protein
MNNNLKLFVYMYEVYLVFFNYRNAKLKTHQLDGGLFSGAQNTSG